MSRGSNAGRTVFLVAATAGVAGLLTYTPPQTEVRAAGPTSERARPVVSGPFTATPASVPFPADPAPATTSTTAVAATVPPAAPEPLPPPPAEVVATPDSAPAPYDPPAPSYPYTYVEPEPEAEAEPAPAGDVGDHCALYHNLLTVLDDPGLRTAVSTVGCD